MLRVFWWTNTVICFTCCEKITFVHRKPENTINFHEKQSNANETFLLEKMYWKNPQVRIFSWCKIIGHDNAAKLKVICDCYKYAWWAFHLLRCSDNGVVLTSLFAVSPNIFCCCSAVWQIWNFTSTITSMSRFSGFAIKFMASAIDFKGKVSSTCWRWQQIFAETSSICACPRLLWQI